MMMKSTPVASFVMPQADFLLEFALIQLNPPTEVGVDQKGDYTMLALDMSPQMAFDTPVVIVADSRKQSAPGNRTLGVCSVISNNGSTKWDSAEHMIGPIDIARLYLENYEKYGAAVHQMPGKVLRISDPKFGKLKSLPNDDGAYIYIPNTEFFGTDSVTVQVELAGRKFKVIWTLKVVDSNTGGPETRRIECGRKSLYWKISTTGDGSWVLQENASVDPGNDTVITDTTNRSFPFGPLSSNHEGVRYTGLGGTTGESPYSFNNITVTFASLEGQALGTTTGTGPTAQITLDTNAAGHGWYIDATPSTNEEFLPTADPTVWQAHAGTAAAGKMDLLSVLLHEYGHALGLEHSGAASGFMSAALQPGVRKLPGADEMALMARLVAQLKGLGDGDGDGDGDGETDGDSGGGTAPGQPQDQPGYPNSPRNSGHRHRARHVRPHAVAFGHPDTHDHAKQQVFDLGSGHRVVPRRSTQYYEVDQPRTAFERPNPSSREIQPLAVGRSPKAAMYDKSLFNTMMASHFNKDTVKALKSEIAGTGQLQQQKILDRLLKIDLAKKPYEPGCFPAGTLVHTKEGLKPIEQIQVGDWVLSKHESGEGERDYRRVTKTFVHEDRQVILIVYGGQQADGSDRWGRFAVTPEHPVWVNGKGWKNAGDLKNLWPRPMVLELLSPENSEVKGNRRLFVTGEPNVAWIPGSSTSDALGSLGTHMEIQTLKLAEDGAFLQFESVRRTGRVKPEHLFRTTVYNFEVEDFHTYYIGEAGVWVHNKNLTAINNGHPLTADLVNMPFYSKAELYAHPERNNIDKGIFLIR